MKNKLITSILVTLSFILISTVVQAVSTLNIQINLPEDLKQVDNRNLEEYAQNSIYLYATNEEKDESVVIVQLENELTIKVDDLAKLKQENMQTFLEQYNKTKSQDGLIVLKQEIYQKDDIIFINTIFEQTANENKIQTEEYYTIINGKAVIISASFLNKDVNTLKIKQAIDSIKITEEDNNNNTTYIWLVPFIPILIIIIYIIKEKRNKIELEENEKRRVLQNVITYMNKINYSKFNGILVLFSITIGLNIINLSLGIVETITQNGLISEYNLITKTYIILAILQNVIQLIGVIYIAYCLTKREIKTIKRIQNTFVYIIISVIVLTIIRLIIQGVLNGLNQNFISYITQETQIFGKSMIYITIWYLYFKHSIRVSIYYKENTLENIIKNPKKGYQTNLVNKKIMEFKIIEYFEKQKAFDYANGIYINKLPKEYVNSLSLSDLNTKKIIRLKRAKYYLSKKDLESPKAEQRKVVKTVCEIIAIYLFMILILYIL